MPQPTPAQAINALWLRLDSARTVALCIADKCEASWDADSTAALGQVMALSAAVGELLTLALADTAALEALV